MGLKKMTKTTHKYILEDFKVFCDNMKNHGSYIQFGRYVWSTPDLNWTEAKVRKYFNLFVSKDDYLPSEKAGLIKSLIKNYLK